MSESRRVPLHHAKVPGRRGSGEGTQGWAVGCPCSKEQGWLSFRKRNRPRMLLHSPGWGYMAQIDEGKGDRMRKAKEKDVIDRKTLILQYTHYAKLSASTNAENKESVTKPVWCLRNQQRENTWTQKTLSLSDLLQEHQDPHPMISINVSFHWSLKRNYSISLFFLSWQHFEFYNWWCYIHACEKDTLLISAFCLQWLIPFIVPICLRISLKIRTKE